MLTQDFSNLVGPSDEELKMYTVDSARRREGRFKSTALPVSVV
jgi:hypothetical protein